MKKQKNLQINLSKFINEVTDSYYGLIECLQNISGIYISNISINIDKGELKYSHEFSFEVSIIVKDRNLSEMLLKSLSSNETYKVTQAKNTEFENYQDEFTIKYEKYEAVNAVNLD